MLVEPPYVPDVCTILVDVHFVPGMTVDEIVADIRRALDPIAAAAALVQRRRHVPPVEGRHPVSALRSRDHPRVLAVTALDVCQRKPAELAIR